MWIIQACHNIQIPYHSLLQRISSMFSPLFFLCFWSIYNCSRGCQNIFEGVSNLVQDFVEDVQGRFCSIGLKFCFICLLMGNLDPDWSNITERFLYNTIFATLSGNAIFAIRSHIALLHNTWAMCERREGDSAHVEKEAKRKKLNKGSEIC